ncbi:uncharacterized protein [Physcomitrium patens]|uniref:NAD(P)-binding domain-containing protein n=1 Tax=Physcomitrium patens TaxID=3218 RepID=A0A7I4F661_PHYPA|nr:suprabasin-like isoform X1 [Physcomitrium patens]XP_024397011.1 suprabasin-like isoform X1 [Physcomitrium patens]XP_024397012.1 suprabasin-like isoform X1 [Physcomitrium patens]|eukprot:XP_024397010.1 suprabasin-like isoform X1 [Physcomitrella patens]
MSMAVVCAHLNLLGPSIVATEAKSCSRCDEVSSSGRFDPRQRKASGGRRGYTSLICRATGVGSTPESTPQRADNQRRRTSQVSKGSTPRTPTSKPVEKPDESKIDAELNAINDDTEYENDDVEYGNDFEEGEEEEYDVQDDSNEGLGDRADEAVGAVADAAGVPRDDATVNRAKRTGKRVGDNLEDIQAEGQESARAVSGSASYAADTSGKRLQKAGERVGKNLEEVGKAGQTAFGESGDVVNQQAGKAVDNVQEGLEEAGKTAQDLASIAQDNAEDAGKQLRKAGENITGDLQDVGKEGQKVLQRGGEAVADQIKDALPDDLSRRGDKIQKDANRAVRKTVKKVEESADRVQDPIEKAVNASMDAAAAIGNEVFRLGDSLIEAVEEATGMSGPDRSSSRPQMREGESEKNESEELVGGKYRSAGKSVIRKYQGGVREGGNDSQEESEDHQEDDAFSGYTVLVAGAAGRTGRLIVKDLVAKGATVRALVRNVYKARNLKQLQGAQLVEGDIYNYEVVKEAMAGSNVVICAVGARGLGSLDLVEAYKTEYEGVLNLISAAKNQGDVKKFVFITTIGVNYLQVVPLLYWKRQAELFLQRSGLDYTIVRPAGLTGERGQSDRVELRPADSLFMGGISRQKVAEVCVSAMVTPSASDKIVEVVGGSGRVRRSIEDQFESI